MQRTILTIAFLLAALPLSAQQRIIDSTFRPVNLGPTVNSVYDDLLPVISPDGRSLYFVRSDSPENLGGARQDIWYSELQADGTWGLAKNIGPPLNNRDHNYLLSITPDGNTILLGDSYGEARQQQQRSVAISHRISGGWEMPKPVKIKNFYNLATYTEYSLGNDGRTMVMAVERKDTKGGKDLYVCFLQPDSSWSEPTSLGPVLNSIGHELTPFLSSDGVSLYFSSDGHGGFGSYDVFVSRRQDSTWTNWSVPENLGPTINTSGWDLYYTIPAKGDYAYYVSHSNTIGAGDIFRVGLPERVRPRPVVLIYGRVLNKKTGEPISAEIVYEIMETNAPAGEAHSTPLTGDYKIVLPAGYGYAFRASAPGFLSESDNIDVTQVTTYQEIERDLYLVPIEEGQYFVLKNVFFDYNKATIRPQSHPELMRVAEILKQYPTMIIEVAGHTDFVGPDDYNKKLSHARAQAVADHIIQMGELEPGRIVGVGYGETKPIADNATDEGRQLNRRVEIKILKK